MRKFIYTLSVLFFMVSCSTNDKLDSESDDILGEWKLAETYVDPGDGSGDYTPVSESASLVFQNNGILISSKKVCFMSDYNSSTYITTYVSSENKINVNDCDGNFGSNYFMI